MADENAKTPRKVKLSRHPLAKRYGINQMKIKIKLEFYFKINPKDFGLIMRQSLLMGKRKISPVWKI
jgi:hypothetical protein